MGCSCSPPLSLPTPSQPTHRGVSHKVVQLVHVSLAKLSSTVVPQRPEAQHLAAVLQELLQGLAVVLAAKQRLGKLGGGVGVGAAEACGGKACRGAQARAGSQHHNRQWLKRLQP